MQIGDNCWYWDRDISQWVAAVITGKDAEGKNGNPTYDVRVVHDGDQRWGYPEQIKPR